MKQIFWTFMFMVSIAYNGMSQCMPYPSQFCAGNDAFCSVDALDGYFCSTPPQDNPTGPDPLCGGTGSPDNTLWWSFLGNGDFIAIRITIDARTCVNRTMGCIGLEAGIMQSCLGAVLDCNANCNDSIIELGGLTISCQPYFFWIDGCCGDVCEFTIETMSSGPPSLPKDLPIPEVQNKICPCGITEVCVGELTEICPLRKQWTVDGVHIPDFDDLDCLEFEVSQDGAPIEVCISYTIGNPNDSSAICDQDSRCITLVPDPIPFIDEGEVYACWEDHEGGGYLWRDTLIFSDCIDPPCRTRTQARDGCCKDYQAEIRILEEREIGASYVFFCDKTDLPYRTEDGQIWSQEACGEEITFSDPDYYDCDSTYILYMSFFDPKVTLTQECGRCDGFVTLVADVRYEPECIYGDISWQAYWVNDKLDTIGTDEELVINEGGTFYYQMHVTYEDEETGKIEQCDLEGLPLWLIVVPEISVDTPILSGTNPVCPATIGTYELDSSFLNPCEYQWSIKRGGGIILTKNWEDSTRIQVDWSNLSGPMGEVCIRVLSDCISSADTCMIVSFLGVPNPDAGLDAILCERSYKMTGTEDKPGGSWEVILAPGNVTMDKNDINTDVAVNANGLYIFVWTETILDCSGTDTVHIIFNTNPTSGPVDTLCSDDATSYRIQFNILEGTSPFRVVQGGGNIDQNDIYTSDSLKSNQTYTIRIQDTFGCTFDLEINHACVCPNEIGLVSSDTIKACGPSTVAIDYNSINMKLGPRDTFEYVLYTQLGNILGSDIDKNHTGIFSFDPNTMIYGQVYYLGVVLGPNDGGDFVNASGGCVQIAEGQPIIWLEMPSPDAGPDVAICSNSYILAGSRSINNSKVKWLNTPGAMLSTPDNINTSVTVTNYGQYIFYFIESNDFCQAMDSVVITFNASPVIADLEKRCLDFGTSTQWKYKVSIGTGKIPFILISGSGTLDPNTGEFSSNNLESLERDTLIVSDANGCRDTLYVVNNCECGLTKKGSMNTDLQQSCVDQCITVSTNNDHGQEADDCVFMILHPDSSNVERGKIIEIQPYDVNGNTFCFDDQKGMVLNQIYYISYVVAECKGNNDINLKDACFKIISKPVQFIPFPSPDAGSDQSICGLFTNLNALQSIGKGNWTLINGPLGANAIFDKSLPGSNLSVDTYGTYTLRWTEDNNGCSATDEVNITFNDAPKWQNVLFECDSIAENYRITFEVTGGDPATWKVTDKSGSSITKLAGNVFQTNWITSGDSAFITITDQLDCDPATLSEMYVCDCITRAGSISVNPQMFCVSGATNVTYSGGTLDPNDQIVYYLHDGNANTLGSTVFASNNTGIFLFDPTTMQYNKIYFITGIVGNDDGSGGIDANDRCLEQTVGQSVVWYEAPEPNISSVSKTLTCAVTSIELDGSNSLNKAGIGSLIYRWSTTNGTFEANADLAREKVNVIGPGTYVLTVTNSITGCEESITYIIDENKPPLNVDPGENQVLNCDQTSVQLDGSNSDSGADIEILWQGPGINASNEKSIQPTVNQPGIYVLTITNTTTGCVYNAQVEVLTDYTSPEASINALGQLACDTKEIQLDGSNSTSINGIRSYTWSTSNGSFVGSQSGIRVVIGSPGIYTLIVTDLKTGCADTVDIEVKELDNSLELFNLNVVDILCFGEQNGQIEIVNITGGDAPYEYAINGGNYGPLSSFSNLNKGRYDLSVKDKNGCILDTFIVISEPEPIDISAKEDQNIGYGDDIDLDTLWFKLKGTTVNEPGTEIIWLDEDGNEIDPFRSNLRQPRYEFTVVVRNANGCEASDVLNIFVKVEKNFYIPNVFVPGTGGGLFPNKKFYIYGSVGSIEKVNVFRVFDRWGELLYQNQGDIPFDSNGQSVEGWDGTFNGSLLNPGVYVYYIELQFKDLGDGILIQKIYGDITLLR